ncbi:class I SAM-dependent methyltransferase [Mangrovibacterium diazotrophicum]|uniref:Methyltransferase family protein n=1 Tax=Mangrovibacterium diazotrophicum TaxID=1261403 RepID=A0A419VV82_9BACT|nr:class I SAM-dependent methyltransferase [Mangrovibacterium diazotrophicum]RKD86031.1 methyltransferase family protein [Mangrovibacterium diazotrophicum]
MKENFDISVQRFNEFADEFNERFKNIDSYQVHLDLFVSLAPEPVSSILELGCGPGNITGFLHGHFPDAQITAIDLAPRMIEIARRSLPSVDFRVMDVRKIRALKRQFDLVMCSFCLPFLSAEDTQKLIVDCAAQISPGGLIYISTMEGDSDNAGFEPTSFSGDSEVFFNYHLKASLEELLREAGIEIEHSVRQDYQAPDGRISTDLILIGRKRRG